MTRRGSRIGLRAGRFGLGLAAAAAAAVLIVPSAVASPESDAADAINRAWDAAGGTGSVVGGKDGDVYQVGAGFAQKFTDGKIFFTPSAGAHLLYGAVLDKYESLGGPADSDLGFPTMDEVPGLVGPDSRVSTFDAADKPAIFWTPDTGAWAVRGPINAAWDKLGGSAGTLGVPTEDERYDGEMIRQRFTGGEITWNTTAKTFSTDPPNLADNLVGLEVPVDATTQINQAWRAAGGLGGPLGARQGEQTPIGDNGAAQGYAGGKIFYTPQTGAHAVTGAILSKYESLGGPTGDLGLPTGTEVEGGVPNSRVSSFSAPDKPVIFWTPDAGAIVIRGAINAAWDKLGGATGTLGVPTAEQSVRGDTVTQKFSGGEISWNRATREFSTKPSELAADLKGLDLPDAVAQAPAGGTAEGSESGSGWQWWWLAIIIPLLLLLGLLAGWARRRPAAAGREDGYDRAWRADRAGEDRTDSDWSAREEPARDSDYAADEDAIDTAPTRVPTEAELADLDRTDGGDPAPWMPGGRSGRHAAGVVETEATWQLDLGELDRPRRRHAAEEPGGWDFGSEERFDDLPDEPAGERFEVRHEERYEASFEEDFTERDPFAGPADQPPGQESAVGEQSEEDETWRPAIHLPLADPYEAPEGYFIKANTHSGLYYTPESVLYENTLPEVWFASEDVAQANGFLPAPE